VGVIRRKEARASATTGVVEPVVAHAEKGAPVEAGLVDIASIIGTLTVTIVWSSL
jgi:predicted secreted protein